MSRFVIGIDLGTTNCTMSYTEILDDSDPKILQLPITQMVSAGLVEDKFSLPSFVYFPLQEELNSKLIFCSRVFCIRFMCGGFCS